MATVLKFEIVQSTDCKSFYIKDTTGVYDDTTNPTGWCPSSGGCGVNYAIADVFSDTLDITLQNGTVIPQIEMYPILPNTDGILYQVLNTALGLAADEPITDQILNIVRTVNIGDLITTETQGVLCQSTCCVAKAAATVDNCGDCDCENEDLENFLIKQGWLLVTQNAVDCNKSLKAAKILSHLTDICNGSDCGCS